MSRKSFRFTILSVLSAPGLAIASIPFWRFEVSRENPIDPSGFGIFAIIFGVTLTALIGAIMGGIFGVVAQRRQEKFFPIRALGFALNAATVIFVIHSFWTWPWPSQSPD